MRILGIDPGIAIVGLGLVESAHPSDVRALDWLTIETAAGGALSDRLCEIARDLEEFLETSKPELVVIEKLFFETNVKTAMDVSQGRGAILLTVAKRGIPILEATPLQLKSAITGDGKADKRQMQDMMMRLLKLAAPPRPDDAADALALAIYGALTSPQLAALQQ